MNFFGVDVYVSEYLPTKRYQYRFPKSRRKRIRKKWARDPRNWRTCEISGVMIAGRPVVSRRVFDELRAALEAYNG